MFDVGSSNSYLSTKDMGTSIYEREASILLVEDDETLSHQLTMLLRNQHYRVMTLRCGSEALNTLKQQHFDLIILDINLPNIDGFELLSYIRSYSTTPTIMLTAFGAEEHRIQGLRFGADDYISKPCNFEEVSLRIEAVLRRTQFQNSISVRYLEYKELTLDKQRQEVMVNGNLGKQVVTLTATQFQLLWVLTKNHGVIQNKPYLYQAVLEREFSLYDRSLDMHLSRIRKTLTQNGMDKERIKTVHGKGYLLK
ncbi:response regulator transcription factor [Vibrio ponticus]|nr:response regulator transcription factor [Vibrio ponticus]